MTKYTPSPWICKPSYMSDAAYNVYDEDGNFLTKSDDVHEANARLIASAPDMLEALEAFIEAERGHDWSGISPTCIERMAYEAARAAIKKAKGE